MLSLSLSSSWAQLVCRKQERGCEPEESFAPVDGTVGKRLGIKRAELIKTWYTYSNILFRYFAKTKSKNGLMKASSRWY